jgi:hypothetical protein
MHVFDTVCSGLQAQMKMLRTPASGDAIVDAISIETSK